MYMATDAPWRNMESNDYPMLSSWWEGHGWPPVPAVVLPKLFVIYDNTAAGGLYMSNCGCGVAMMEWLVTDPKAKPLAAAKALRKVIEFLKDCAKRMDYGAILTTCRQPSLARFIEGSGFQKTDTGMIHLLGVF
jgi:hypothetical protein